MAPANNESGGYPARSGARSTAAGRPLALLFDLDGTLLDSIGLILSSARHAFEGRALCPTDAQWIAGIGTPLRTQLREFARSDDDVETLVDRYRAFQKANHDRMVRCYDDVVDTIAALKRGGHPIGVVTSKADDLMWRSLDYVGLQRYVDVGVGCDSCDTYKPEPGPVLHALSKIGYEPSEAVMIGDSPHDMLAGRAAGTITVAALWGPFTREQLKHTTPDHYIETISGLVPLVERIEQSSR